MGLADPPPIALITGVTGQDGYYLSRLLVDAGVVVHGVMGHEQSTADLALPPGVTPHSAVLSQAAAVHELVGAVAPDYVFHLAGVSSVARSWSEPVYTTEVNALSTAALLDACLREQDASGRRIAVVNASSAEVFAGSADSPQTEATPIAPTSPYGASKALGHVMCQVYRGRGLAASNAILYNHESPRRPATFVTRKITQAAAAIARGQQQRLTLGDISIRRDWGWAPDYVDAMWRMARNEGGDDFIVATGVAHSIAEFTAAAFAAAGIEDWRSHVDTDEALIRPADRADMVGDAAKAQSALNWKPTMAFEQIVAAMVHSDREQESHP